LFESLCSFHGDLVAVFELVRHLFQDSAQHRAVLCAGFDLLQPGLLTHLGRQRRVDGVAFLQLVRHIENGIPVAGLLLRFEFEIERAYVFADAGIAQCFE
jgi:hypothetical protein